MGEPAKKLKAIDEAPPLPDVSKPIELAYFYSKQTFGAMSQNVLVSKKSGGNGSSFSDGYGVSGTVEEIWLLPSGQVIATVSSGIEGSKTYTRIVATGGGNGKVLT